MTYARKTLVSLQDTPYYHLTGRCVRRAWLWGFDQYAGRDYSHRKAWVLERMAQLSAVFTLDVCAYAIMSNHYHLVVHVDAKRAARLTDEEVVERWTRLYARPTLVERWASDLGAAAERDEAERLIAVWRRRLCDVSWYMRCLNEHLARRANAEDECTGRFWEGRFKSQALLDECGLLTAMAYVDLNPVRAGIAATPEESEFTSMYERIKELKRREGIEPAANRATQASVRPPLHAFRSDPARASNSIPFAFHDYLELIEWTGRMRREDKRGAINAKLPPILERLNMDSEAWCTAMQPRGNVFGRAIGRLDHMRLHAKTLGQSWVRGLRSAELLYGQA